MLFASYIILGSKSIWYEENSHLAVEVSAFDTGCDEVGSGGARRFTSERSESKK